MQYPITDGTDVEIEGTHETDIAALRVVDPTTAAQVEELNKPKRPLVAVMDRERLAVDLGIDDGSKATRALALIEDPGLKSLASTHARKLIDVSLDDPKAQEVVKGMVDGLGIGTQRAAARKSALLKEPIRTLAMAGDEKSGVGRSLIDLSIQVQDLDPRGFDFEPGGFSRFIGKMLPSVVADPMRRYFMKFQSADAVMEQIRTSLIHGRENLTRDNDQLAADQIEMRVLTLKLQKIIAVGEMIDRQVQSHVDTLAEEDPKRKFLLEEVLFPLRQRIQDLQQQLAVNQTGVMAIEVIVQTNKQLIRGVIRAENVTMTALNVAVLIAMAQTRQRLVLKTIQRVNEVTDNLFDGIAERMGQGVEIHKMAAGTMLNIATLQRVFTATNKALEDIGQFRQAALPQMAAQVLEMDRLTGEAEEAIRRIEKGRKAQVVIDLPSDA